MILINLFCFIVIKPHCRLGLQSGLTQTITKTQYTPITKTYAIYKYFVQRVKNKNRNYLKFFIFFLFFSQNIDCGYSLEPPCRGGSNEYPQSMF